MTAFASGDVDRSINIYDAIIEADPKRRPYLWQRGLSLYYAGRYQDGADQFAADVAVNPNDTEEQIWHLLCLAQLTGSLEEARAMKLAVGKDRRPVMRAVQSLFLSGGSKDERELVDLAENGDLGSRFYANLYLSLYYESTSNVSEAEKWMAQAVNTDYARSVGRRDPMVELAKVAVNKRGWSSLAVK
jgi:lipoprotein NlpI